jgi:uncharacterized ion transporter superfamily protein YfcC
MGTEKNKLSSPPIAGIKLFTQSQEVFLVKSFFERVKVPHVFVLITGVILFCSLLSYVIPSGYYQREKKEIRGKSRTVVIPGTYQVEEKYFSLTGILFGEQVKGKATPVSLEQFLSAIPRGMMDSQAAEIIFFIFIIGGVFGILQRTGTIAAGVHKLIEVFKGSTYLLTVIMMIVLAIGGSTMGMGEEFIPLIPIFLMVSREMGYDRIYGMAIVILAADIGFAAATTNPFTVVIAQGIAEVPLYSGMMFRVVFLTCCLVITIIYLLRYGANIKKNPEKALMGKEGFEIEEHKIGKTNFSTSHLLILLISGLIFVFILYAVQEMGWWMAEMSGGFLLMGFVAIAIARLPFSEAANAFVQGMKEMVVAALVVGFARGILMVLNDGEILDTLIYSAAGSLQHFSNYVAAAGMLVFQTTLNFFIPSGSGQAAVTMPLMAPLADVLGITRKTAVFAFTCGDGFSNTIIPTSGILMAMLSLAKIPYEKWLRFMFPLFLQLILLSIIFLTIAVAIQY